MAISISKETLAPGLYLVATPIGNLRDITLRALSTLASADLIACEDTRVTAHLLRHYGIDIPTTSYHDHNAAKKRPELLQKLAKGQSVALVSDAGTPLISDPGYKLAREAMEAGVAVTAIPGPSSALAALCVSGLPSDRFAFLGFLPTTEGKARAFLEPYVHLPATLIIFESAKRVADTLALLQEALGERDAAVARELTKLYEETRRGTLTELAAHYHASGEPRGEVVIAVGPPGKEEAGPEAIDAALRSAMTRASLKDAVEEVANLLRANKKHIYARALEIKRESS